MSLGMAYVAFHFPSPEILQDKNKVVPLLKAIQSSGWKLRKPARLGSPEEFIATPDEVAAVWEEATDPDQLGATVAFCNTDDFEVKLGIDYSLHWKKLLLFVRGSDVVEYSDRAAANMSALLEVCELVYTFLSPIYGYGAAFADQVPLEEYKDTSSTIYAAYDLNFLGPELVERYGREQCFHCLRTVKSNLRMAVSLLLLCLMALTRRSRAATRWLPRCLGFKPFDVKR